MDRIRTRGTGSRVAPILAACLLAVACGDADPREAAGAASWPSYGFDHANSLNNTAETRLSTGNVADLAEAWRLDSGGVTGTPVVADATVYFADWEGVIHAVQADDGGTIWQQQVTDVPISGSVAVTHGMVVAGDLGGTLHAVDRDSAHLLWSTSLDAEASLFASPVVVDDTVIIGTTDTELVREDHGFRAAVVAVNLEDGSERWRLHTDPDGTSGTWIPIWSSAAYDPDRGEEGLGHGVVETRPGA